MYILQSPSPSKAKMPPPLPVPDKVIELTDDPTKLFVIPTRASSLPSYGAIPVLVMVATGFPAESGSMEMRVPQLEEAPICGQLNVTAPTGLVDSTKKVAEKPDTSNPKSEIFFTNLFSLVMMGCGFEIASKKTWNLVNLCETQKKTFRFKAIGISADRLRILMLGTTLS